MIENYHFPKCSLVVGKHKSIPTSIQLRITSEVADEIAGTEEKQLKAEGELSFDSYATNQWDCPVKPNAVGQLTIIDDSDTSKLNILFVEKTCEHVLVKDKIKRFFWLFYVIGKPVSDKLELFPEWYMTGNRVFYCTDFRGFFWASEVSSVVVAETPQKAKRLLLNALHEAGVDMPEMKDLTLKELDLGRAHAVVLNKGE
mgnify:CR=1 FL=1